MPVELRSGELRRAVALRGTCPHRPLMLRVFERVASPRRLETLRGDALLLFSTSPTWRVLYRDTTEFSSVVAFCTALLLALATLRASPSVFYYGTTQALIV